MITFTLLAITLFVVLVVNTLIFLIGGSAILLTFSDFIVCGLMIYLIIKIMRKNRKK